MKKVVLSMFLLSGILFAQNAQDIIADNGCMSCHNIMDLKSAPAFAGIARKNKRFYSQNAKSNIMNSIKNGSQGKYRRFAGTKMPAFSHLNDTELNILADYILSLKANKNCKQHGGNRPY